MADSRSYSGGSRGRVGYGRGRGHHIGGSGGNFQNQYVSQGGQRGEYYQGAQGWGRGGIGTGGGCGNYDTEYVARGRGSYGHRDGGRRGNYKTQYVQNQGGQYYQGGVGRARGFNNPLIVEGSKFGGPQQAMQPPQHHQLSSGVERVGRGAWTGSPSSSTDQSHTIFMPLSWTQRAPESSPGHSVDLGEFVRESNGKEYPSNWFVGVAV